MFFLGEKLGKQSAHRILYETSMAAAGNKQPLVDLLMAHPEISEVFKKGDLEKTIAPNKHIGMSRELTHRVVKYVSEQLPHTRPQEQSERVCPLSDKDGPCCV